MAGILCAEDSDTRLKHLNPVPGDDPRELISQISLDTALAEMTRPCDLTILEAIAPGEKQHLSEKG